ncbi:MAG: tol-pal system-associated acyl-CoA thioesterase [Alphaproteobacteria bacterium]
MTDKTHVFALRVYYEDTDAGGIVYYANYFKFAERARTEMMRDIGIESSRMMEDHGLVFAVRSLSADYKKPARLDDRLEVHTTVEEIGGASMTGRQRVMRGDEELVDMSIRLVCMDETAKAARITGDVRDNLEKICAT